jgi:hypothetical protein
MRQLLAAALLLTAGLAQAAGGKFFSTRAGNWNDGATWGKTSPGVAGTDYPSSGDYATVVKNTTVTIPSGFSVDPASVTINSGTTLVNQGRLIISGTLTMNPGPLSMAQGGAGDTELDVYPGGTLNIASSSVVLNTASGFSINTLHFWGTSASHATISATGGWFKQGSGGGFDGVDSSWTYVDFTGLGANDTMYATSGANFRVSSCTFTDLRGTFTLPDLESTVPTDRYIEYSDFKGSRADPIIVIGGSSAKLPTGRNDFFHNTVDSDTTHTTGVNFYVEAASVTIRRNVFRNIFLSEITTPGSDGNTIDNIFISTMNVNAPQQTEWKGTSVTVRGNFFYTESDNPHNWQWDNSTRTVTYNVIEINTAYSRTDDGDVDFECPTCLISSGTIAYNIIIGKVESTEFLSMQGNASLRNFTLMHHNTMWFDGTYAVTQSCFRVGESYGGKAGMFPFIADNICVAKSSDTSAHVETDLNVGAATDKITFMDYNGTNFIAGTPYQSTKSAGTYGSHDTQANPLFVDPTRDLLSWGQSLGTDGSSSAVITKLLQMNSVGADPSYDVIPLMAYIRAGFTPQNAVYKGAGHDGSDLGAVPVQPIAAGFLLMGTP